MPLEIKESRMEPDITVAHLSGRLGLGEESHRLEALGSELAAGGNRAVILDLSHVEAIDSAGIGGLAMAAGQIQRAGGHLVVVTGPGKMKSMLQVTGLYTLMPVAETIEQALAQLGSPRT